MERSYSHCHIILTSAGLRHRQPTQLCSSEGHVPGLCFSLRALYVHGLSCSRMFLGLFPSVVYPCPKYHNKGHPRTFGPTKRVYLETIAVFPPLKSQSRPGASRCTTALAVGGKQGGRERQWELIRIDRPLCTSNKREDDITAGRGVLVLVPFHTFTFPSTSSHSPPSQ